MVKVLLNNVEEFEKTNHSNQMKYRDTGHICHLCLKSIVNISKVLVMFYANRSKTFISMISFTRIINSMLYPELKQTIK